jgi:replicative DNA helicase
MEILTPPHDDMTEKSLLGSMLLSQEAIEDVIDIISPKDFYQLKHQKIAEKIFELYHKKENVDLVTLASAFNGNLDEIGGLMYLTELVNSIPTTQHAPNYARIVLETSKVRSLVQVLGEAKEKAFKREYDDFNEFVNETEKSIFEVNRNSSEKSFSSSKEILLSHADNIINRSASNGITGLSTGLKLLDAYTAGFHPSQLIIVAARPAMGKTAFALQISKHVAKKYNETVALFSLEMSKESLIERMIVNEMQIDSNALRLGLINKNDEELQKLMMGIGKISEYPLEINDDGLISVSEMRKQCRKLKAEKGLSMIVVDYLQLMSGKGENRNAQITEISRGLKLLAKEFEVPVIALSQLSRAVEHTNDKRPGLSHLRESGAIEQDADVVLFLHRPEYYEPNNMELKGLAEIIIAKQREGATGILEIAWKGEYQRFYDLSKLQEVEPKNGPW